MERILFVSLNQIIIQYRFEYIYSIFETETVKSLLKDGYSGFVYGFPLSI